MPHAFAVGMTLVVVGLHGGPVVASSPVFEWRLGKREAAPAHGLDPSGVGETKPRSVRRKAMALIDVPLNGWPVVNATHTPG